MLGLVACHRLVNENYRKGDNFMAAGRYDSALVYYRLALEEDTGNPGLLTNLAICRYYLDDLDTALRLARQASALPWEDQRPRLVYAEILLEAGQTARADSVLNLVRQADSTLPMYWYLRSVWAGRTGRIAESLNWINKALEAEPSTLPFLLQQARAYVWNRQWDEGIYRYTRLIRNDSANAGLFNNRGYAKLMAGMKEPALSDLGKALQLNGELVPAWNNYALALWMTGDTAGGKDIIDSLIHSGAANATSFLYGAYFFLKSQDTTNACHFLERAKACIISPLPPVADSLRELSCPPAFKKPR